MPVRLRMAVDGDVSYIIKTWRETYAKDSAWSKNMPRQIYHSHHRKLIERLLETTHTLVACNDEDPTHLVGFVSYERVESHLVIHFIFTRYELRNFGIARKLLEGIGGQPDGAMIATHWTWVCDRLPDHYRLNLVYNPYLLMQQFRERHHGQKQETPG